MSTTPLRIAIVSPGDRATRDTATGADGRFADLFEALTQAGHRAEPAIYHDDFCDEVRAQLLDVDVALVWVNPVHEGRNRSVLDHMLGEVAAAGVHVSAHPDVVLALGTKHILYDIRDLEWGCHTDLYRTPSELRRGLAATLATGPRVIKQHRGSSGAGVWSVEAIDPTADINGESTVRARHAKRGSSDQLLTLEEFCAQCEHHLSSGEGLLIDQAFQPRIGEGMVRCYLVRDRVAGFGHQAINALIPASDDGEAPEPGPRLYYPPTMPEHQRLKTLLEDEWLRQLQELMGIETERLPILWDCDFLLGSPDADGNDTYVLCEINVSSVAPYPESAVAAIVDAVSALTPAST